VALVQDDSFGNSKKVKIVKKEVTDVSIKSEFLPPSFDQGPSRPIGKEKASHSKATELFLDSKKELPSTPLKQAKSHTKFRTPTVPPPLQVEQDVKGQHSSAQKLVSLSDMPIPKLEAAMDSVSVTPKPMKSILKTPLIAGVFTSPPLSQKLQVPLAALLDDSSPKKSTQEEALDRGLAPSPEKKASSKRTFTRSVVFAKYKCKHTDRNIYRGGLAEHAKALMGRSMTDYTLWYKDISTSTKSLEPALYVQVIEVITCNPPTDFIPVFQGHSQTSKPSFWILTRCSRMPRNENHSAEILILFSAIHNYRTPEGTRKQVATLQNIQPGRKIQIWKPWTLIPMPQTTEKVNQMEETNAILCSRYVVQG
jgi:hypothetical protein